MRHQRLELTGRLGREPFEDILEVLKRIVVVEFRGLDQAHGGGGPLTGAQRSGEQPVLSFMHGRS